jgi:16S rRNA (cytidine1402-2'-O)-methyltransferase
LQIRELLVTQGGPVGKVAEMSSDLRTRPPAGATRAGAARGRYVVAGHAFNAPSLAAGLYVVATPIGHLGDVTLRALEVLAQSDAIACEDTRVTRKLLDHYGIVTPLIPYHDHNAAEMRPKILKRLAQGETVSLVSDAGTPLVSDPGYKLVLDARAAGHAVTALPGASAVLAALTVSALPTDQFFFAGFLPAKAEARRTRIAELARIPATLVVFETGPRLAAALADLASGLGAREGAICRELTKLHEEVRRGTLSELAQLYAGTAAPRGEIVIVVGPPPEDADRPDAADVDDMLRQALARVSVKDAVSEVAGATGVSRREVYRRALALAQGNDDGAPP